MTDNAYIRSRSKSQKSIISGMTRRRFLSATAAATGTFFLAKTDVLAKGLGLLAKSTPTAASPIDYSVLQKRIQGTVIASGADNFKPATEALVWNSLKPDRKPDVIVRVKNDDDVVEAINFARENKLKVVVRGGGHNWQGLAVRDGGMTIDLSDLTSSEIDKANMKAVIQPVIANRDLANRLAIEGLAFPIGHCPTVKASGYLLNGGMAWNMGVWGPAAYSVEAVEFVTADGKKVKASKDEHPELFYAARGAGPGMFAVATKYHLKCYPLPKAIMSSSYWYSLDDLKEVADQVVDIGWNKMPANVELSIFMLKAPAEIADKCKKYNGMCCMIASVAFGDTEAESKAALAPLAEASIFKKALKSSLNDKTSFDELGKLSGQTWPEGRRNFAENRSSHKKASDMLMAMRDKFAQAPSNQSVIVFCQSTGKRNLVETKPDIALSMEGSSYGGIWTIWDGAENDEKNKKSHDELVEIFTPYMSGGYIGETNYVQDNKRVRTSFTPEKWKRLEAAREKYDPTGLFFGFLGGVPKSEA